MLILVDLTYMTIILIICQFKINNFPIITKVIKKIINSKYSPIFLSHNFIKKKFLSTHNY